MSAPTVALLGTGTMGAGMARNLAKSLPTRVWNRSREKAEPLAEAGATVAGSVQEAVDGADVVLTMLFDSDAVSATMREATFEPGTVWVQSTTVGVTGAEDLGRLAADLGLVYVDAPVLGTKKPAEDGALVVLASGPDDVKSTLEPVFDAIGSRTMWLGAAGQGSRLKLVANGWVITVVDGIAQALRTAEALGVDPQLFLEAVKGGALDSPYVQLKGSAMLDGSWDPSFSTTGILKDAALIEDAARTAGADPAFVALAREHFTRAVEAGHGDKDMSAVYLTLPPG